MKTFIVAAVKDELMGTYLQPVFGESEDELKRIFTYQINNIGLWKANPNDFNLYKLGEFCDTTGDLIPDQKRIMNGSGAIKKEEKEDNDFFDNELTAYTRNSGRR